MGRRRAILIGNETFPAESGFGPLRGALNDVAALERVLTDQSRGAFELAAVLRDAPFAAMHDAIEDALNAAGQDDTILIHYSGHGQVDFPEGRLYLAGTDSQSQRLRRTALRADDLVEMVRKSNASAVVLLLDCCFAAAIGKAFTRSGDAVEAALREAAKGLFILASASARRVSQEVEEGGGAMGPLTRAVVDRIGAADEVRFSHLSQHVERALAAQEARTFKFNAEGDPLIAREVPRETPEERRQARVTEWWDRDGLAPEIYGPAFEIAGGRGEAAIVAQIAALLDAPVMTARAFEAAWRRRFPGQVGVPVFVPPVASPKVSAPARTEAAEVWPPLTPLARWREPVPGLPEAGWPDMVTLPAGVFTMGAPEGEESSKDVERPQREVTVERPFAIGRVAVRFAQWDAAMDAGFVPPSGPKAPPDQGWGRGERPVINVSWEDAQAYCAWLNARRGLRAGTYRLPSEAEWEYACRAGTTTPFSFGATIAPSQVNYDGNYTYGKGKKGEYRERTVPVGSLPANDWGLHEMHGNVWEWCEDAFGDYPDRPTDSRPLTPSASSLRVLRGGSWDGFPSYCRSAFRYGLVPEDRLIIVGFRLARTLF